ncbi:MAG TPA: 50S ribosomal protein L11 methyltransferase [Capsulimonadaceae bacterium]|nr:50S ribosomal protein L11 methyltransferase [Capsulimonadaceae bacterium]
MQWAAISIDAEGEEAQQAATRVLIDLGCNGVALEDEGGRITGYLPSDDRLETSLRRIKGALAMLSAIGVEGVAEEITIRFVKEEDWANAWKAYFKPIRVGRHLIVSPPWEDARAGERDRVVVIDPGMAFGTGNHPTTQLCLAALEDYVAPGAAVADIGAGSGILAIAAAKLGASEVVATDIDPMAVQIAARNAAENGVSLDTGTNPPLSKQFDLVVSNILANVLIEMADDLAAMTKPSGVLIASGIIDERENDVRLYLEGAGFTCIETRRRDEWVALVLRREA